MKKQTYAIDQNLYNVIIQDLNTAFTIRQFRDLFAEKLNADGINDVPIAKVRLYVYENLRRMIKAGWVKTDEKLRKRDQLYHLLDVPENIELKFTQGKFHRRSSIESSAEVKATQADPPTDCQLSLRGQLKELELEMLATMGEVERYKQLMDDMPVLSSQLQKPFDLAREKSSKLIGHFRAVENTLQMLEAR